MYVGHSAVRKSASALTGLWALEGALEPLEAIEQLSTFSGSCPIAKEESEVEAGAIVCSTPSSQLRTLQLLDIVHRMLELL